MAARRPWGWARVPPAWVCDVGETGDPAGERATQLPPAGVHVLHGAASGADGKSQLSVREIRSLMIKL